LPVFVYSQFSFININNANPPAATDRMDEPIREAFSTNTFFFRNGIKLNGRSIARDNTPVPIDTENILDCIFYNKNKNSYVITH